MAIALTPTQRVVKRARAKGVKVFTRTEWGSRYGKVYAMRRITRRAKRPADTVVQHITVTRPSGDLRADAREVERIGYQRFGSGVSYNFLVDMTTGAVAVGQPLDAKGTHTVNLKALAGFSYDQNKVARAIAVVGMEHTKLSDKAARSIAMLIEAMIEAGEVTIGFDYMPHSKFAWKDCPCDSTRDRMPAIRKRVADDIQAARARKAAR